MHRSQEGKESAQHTRTHAGSPGVWGEKGQRRGAGGQPRRLASRCFRALKSQALHPFHRSFSEPQRSGRCIPFATS
eukprot:7040638-Pyramimonas_sp.AAC.1